MPERRGKGRKGQGRSEVQSAPLAQSCGAWEKAHAVWPLALAEGAQCILRHLAATREPQVGYTPLSDIHLLGNKYLVTTTEAAVLSTCRVPPPPMPVPVSTRTHLARAAVAVVALLVLVAIVGVDLLVLICVLLLTMLVDCLIVLLVFIREQV